MAFAGRRHLLGNRSLHFGRDEKMGGRRARSGARVDVFRLIVGLTGVFLYPFFLFLLRLRRGLTLGLVFGASIAALPPIFPRRGDGGRPLLALHGRGAGLVLQARGGAVDRWYVIHSHRSFLLLRASIKTACVPQSEPLVHHQRPGPAVLIAVLRLAPRPR
jgi:hypothetical protein